MVTKSLPPKANRKAYAHKSSIKTWLILLLALQFSSITSFAQTDTGTVKVLTELSLDDLLNMKVITASGTEQKISEAPATMTVITAQQIEERGYEQLEDALRDVPGIDFVHLNGYAPTLIYFRGMYGAENLRALLMIDGVVENNIIGDNDMAGPAYNLHNVLRIEIIWGPASALYGADAFGGVINIITKKGSEINGLRYQKGYGTNNTSLQTIMMGTKKSNWDISVTGSLYSTDGPVFYNLDPNYDASYVNNAWSLNASVAYETGQSKTTLAARAYDTPMGWGEVLNSATAFFGLPSAGNGNTGTFGLIDHSVNNEKPGLEDPFYHTYYLQEDYAASDKLKLMGRATYRETGIGNDSYAFLDYGPKLYYVPTADYSNRAEGDATADYTINNQNKLSAGVQYYQDNIEQGSRAITVDATTPYLLDGRDTVYNLYSTFKTRKFNIRSHFGSYLQYILSTNLLGKTDFTLGGRYDYDSYYSTPLTPRAAIVNRPTDDLTFKLMFGSAFRAPTNTEVYEAPPGSYLTTEKINTYEVNVIYKISKQYLAQVNGFINNLTDAISITTLPSTARNKNPVTETINGLEAKLDMLWSKTLTGFANFTYQDGTGTNTVTNITRDLPDVAKVKGNAGLMLHVQDLFNVSLIGNWVGNRLSPITDPYGTVSGYFLTNCTITTSKLFDKRISASIEVRNIFNVTWLDPGIRTADGLTYPTEIEQPGRTTMLKFILTF